MPQPPDLLVLGQVATLAGEAGYGWVEALAITDGRVTATGSVSELTALAGRRTRRLQLAQGQVALPAVTDAHLHLVAAAVAADELDLGSAASLADGLALVTRADDERSGRGDDASWIVGHGWTMDRWGTPPTVAALEVAAPGRAVALWAHDHHTLALSAAALAVAGLGPTTPDPAGGALGRTPDGRLSGLLHESATALAEDVVPWPDEGAIRAALERYASRLVSLGVVGVHDPGDLVIDDSLDGSFAIVRRLAAEGRLPLRVHAGIREPQLDAAIAAGLRSGHGLPTAAGLDRAERRARDRYRLGWLKLFADGSVGSRTAAMLEPFSDAADRPGPAGPSGELLMSPAALEGCISRAAVAGIATMVHAIGDAAVRAVLDGFERSGSATLAALPLRPRIEHAQLVALEDRPRFARSGIAASMQPIQLQSDEATMRTAWAERTELAFPAASLAAAGAAVVFGTDAPVEPPDPWPGIAMAVTRRSPGWGAGAPPSAPHEAVSLVAALRAATVGPAMVAGDRLGGRLVFGSPADLVVIELEPGTGDAAAAERLRSASPLLTLLDGDERHRALGFDR